MTKPSSFTRMLVAILLLPAVVSCGGGSDVSDPAARQGRIIVKIRDEPLDTVSSVHLQFREITLQRRDGQELTKTFEPRKVVDVLAYREGRTAILADWMVPPGEYEALRLTVDAEPNVRDSYVTLVTGEECELVVQEPAGWSAYWPAGQISDDPAKPTSLLLHVDLFSSVRGTDCAQGVVFVPTLSLVDEDKSGWFEGYVDIELYQPDCRPRVYVGILDNLYTPDVSPLARPLAVAGVDVRDGRPYYRTPNLYPLIQQMPNGTQQTCPLEWPRYGFCPQPASYRLSFTCDEDDPNVQEALRFSSVSGGLIFEGKATHVDLLAPLPY